MISNNLSFDFSGGTDVLIMGKCLLPHKLANVRMFIEVKTKRKW